MKRVQQVGFTILFNIIAILPAQSQANFELVRVNDTFGILKAQGTNGGTYPAFDNNHLFMLDGNPFLKAPAPAENRSILSNTSMRLGSGNGATLIDFVYTAGQAYDLGKLGLPTIYFGSSTGSSQGTNSTWSGLLSLNVGSNSTLGAVGKSGSVLWGVYGNRYGYNRAVEIGSWKIIPPAPMPTIGKTYGLFVGVQDENVMLRPMNGNGIATELYNSFTRNGRTAELLTANRFFGGSIGKDQIAERLGVLKSQMKIGDQLVVYFNSHGGQSGNNEYLALGKPLYDFDLANLLHDFDSAGDFKKSVFIDACLAGGFADTDPNEVNNYDLRAIPNTALFASATEDTLMYYSKIDGYGFYSKALLSAFDNGLDYSFSADQLADYLGSEAKRLADDLPQGSFFYEGGFGDAVPVDTSLMNSVLKHSQNFDISQSVTRPVPEPATAFLMTLGIALIVYRGLNRQTPHVRM